MELGPSLFKIDQRKLFRIHDLGGKLGLFNIIFLEDAVDDVVDVKLHLFIGLQEGKDGVVIEDSNQLVPFSMSNSHPHSLPGGACYRPHEFHPVSWANG